MSERGLYIVIEGNDGTGKSTQVDLLAHHYRQTGRETVIVEEPGSDDPEKSTPVASHLRAIIKNNDLKRDPEINLALFSAARRELWQQKIAPALGRDAVVLSARNYFSTLAYQGKGEGIDEQHIIETTALFTDPRYMTPDHMVILTSDDEAERAKRIAGRGALEKPDTFESRDAEFQARVNQAYLDLADEHNIAVINVIENDTHKTPNVIHAEIRKLIDRLLLPLP